MQGGLFEYIPASQQELRGGVRRCSLLMLRRLVGKDIPQTEGERRGYRERRMERKQVESIVEICTFVDGKKYIWYLLDLLPIYAVYMMDRLATAASPSQTAIQMYKREYLKK